jgi:hypothetical protein
MVASFPFGPSLPDGFRGLVHARAWPRHGRGRGSPTALAMAALCIGTALGRRRPPPGRCPGLTPLGRYVRPPRSLVAPCIPDGAPVEPCGHTSQEVRSGHASQEVRSRIKAVLAAIFTRQVQYCRGYPVPGQHWRNNADRVRPCAR